MRQGTGDRDLHPRRGSPQPDVGIDTDTEVSLDHTEAGGQRPLATGHCSNCGRVIMVGQPTPGRWPSESRGAVRSAEAP